MALRVLPQRHGRIFNTVSSLQRGFTSSTTDASSISAQSHHTITAASNATAPPNARWLDDVRSRIGKCIMFGLKEQQMDEAVVMLEQLARDWRELLAGGEGYLTQAARRGLYKQAVVWGEMDSMPPGHVNNVTYNRYAESARIGWAANYADKIDPAHKQQWRELWTPKGDGLILRSIRTDFKFPMTYPDRVSVYHKLQTLPKADTDSFILDVIILSEKHRRPAARCLEDIVLYDYRRGKKISLESRPFMLDAFRETFRLQEEAKATNGRRREALIEQVRQLEKDSWDREGAKEDLGSAAT